MNTKCGRSVVVEDVVVRSNLQGKGIGREMMKYAAEAARKFGGEKLVLSSGKARTQAHDFYEHIGYKKDGFRFALNLEERKRLYGRGSQEKIVPPRIGLSFIDSAL